MKKLLITLTALAISIPALAQNLPFVGERYFNFLGGSGTGYTIEIKASGDTHIQLHGTQSSATIYQGKYQTYLPYIFEGKIIGYHQIKGDKIYELDKNKQPITGCDINDETKPCVDELSAD